MNVPDEAVEAAARAICRHNCSLVHHWDANIGCNLGCRSEHLDLGEARAALAAAAPFLADGTGWRPIDSAPKDGTEILLYGRCERNGRYYAADRNVGWWQADDECWQARDLPINPMHWQPLPAPPLKAEG